MYWDERPGLCWYVKALSYLSPWNPSRLTSQVFILCVAEPVEAEEAIAAIKACMIFIYIFAHDDPADKTSYVMCSWVLFKLGQLTRELFEWPCKGSAVWKSHPDMWSLYCVPYEWKVVYRIRQKIFKCKKWKFIYLSKHCISISLFKFHVYHDRRIYPNHPHLHAKKPEFSLGSTHIQERDEELKKM